MRVLLNWEHNGLHVHLSTYERLLDKLAVLNKARPLPTSSVQNIKGALAIEWTYNSNSIEGNTLSLRETQMVLEDGITIGGKSLREHFEAVNHAKAIEYLHYLMDKDELLSAGDILSIHRRVMMNIQDDYAGRLRDGAVRIRGANFVPPNAGKVPAMLEEIIAYTNANPDNLNVIQLATLFHHKFVWVHPFFDGNGRTVRLSMNVILLKAGFPPAIILANDRKKYYAALNQANKGEYSKLALLMAQALERSLNIYLSAIPHSDSDYRPIHEVVNEPEVPYGQDYVSLLARQGKIDAHKEGRSWYTSKSAILDYMRLRERKRISSSDKRNPA